jgi:hypothetical protein
MPLLTSITSNANRESRSTQLDGELPEVTYLATHVAEQSIGYTTEATLNTIKATLAAQEIGLSRPIGNNDSSSSDSRLTDRGKSPTSLTRSMGETSAVSPVRVIHRWEGTVLYVYDEFFEAKITSLTDESSEGDATAEFSVEDLSDDDLSLLIPGASFYVTAILERRSGGRIRHSSDVRFRRLGRWHSAEIALLKERAKKRRSALGFEDEAG